MSLFDDIKDSVYSIFNIQNDGANSNKKGFVQYIHKDECNSGPCESCSYNDLRIFEDNLKKPAIGILNHLFCDCKYKKVDEYYVDDLIENALDVVVLSIRNNNKLPDYYITKKEAEEVYGWNKSKNTIAGKAPGKMIGGDVYANIGERLPVKNGRIWYECDINYQYGKRNNERLYYSNDGLMFFSDDHGCSSFYHIG